MNELKPILATILFVVSLIVGTSFLPARADTGDPKATRQAGGNALGGVVTSVTNGALATVLSAKSSRASVTCTNASAVTVKLGSATASVFSLQELGLPLLASATINMYGYAGAMSAVTDIGVTSTASVRCLEGLTQ